MMKKIMAAVVVTCILVLLLPSHCPIEGSYLPSFLHLGNHQKMLAAFLLGIITMGLITLW